MLTKSSIFLLIYQLEGDVLKSYFMMMASSICLCSSDHYCYMCFEVMLLNRPISNSSIILVILKLLSTRIGSLSTSDAVRVIPLCVGFSRRLRLGSQMAAFSSRPRLTLCLSSRVPGFAFCL